jgi:hypothetical protein
MSIKIAAGGDVNFSKHRGEISYLIKRKKAPLFVRYWRKLIKREILWPIYKIGEYSPTDEIQNIFLEEYGGSWENSIYEISEYSDDSIPFKRIKNFFKASDIGYINLETPLSEKCRHIGAFCSSPKFARILKDNNIMIVSLANNHSFDGGEKAFIETMNILKANSIKFFGGGMNIKEARKGETIEIGGLKIGFLGYSSICNSFFTSLAKNEQPGILPLFEPIVLSDIETLKMKCDFLIVSPHFDIEHKSKIHKNSITIAHKMVDHGADLIIGSHAHVPKPIEIYKGKLIIYCLGHLIFLEKIWGNSLIAKIILSDAGNYEKAIFYAINTKDKTCYSPYVLEDLEGDLLLSEIQKKSKTIFGTPLVFDNHCLQINNFSK